MPGSDSAPRDRATEVARDAAPDAAPDFASRVLDIVGGIPAGQVMSYGDVAAVMGSQAARMVGRVMAYSGHEVAWWRVVRASGHPAQGHEAEALGHFRVEGTPLLWSAAGYRVDIAEARHRG